MRKAETEETDGVIGDADGRNYPEKGSAVNDFKVIRCGEPSHHSVPRHDGNLAYPGGGDQIAVAGIFVSRGRDYSGCLYRYPLFDWNDLRRRRLDSG